MNHTPRYVILFDGVCNFCNGAVNFVIDRDSEERFRFASLQSEAGRALAEHHGIGPRIETMALIEDDRAYTESTAALKVVRRLSGFWPLLYVFALVPRPLRNFLYRGFAARRYAWFGKSDVCRVPTPEVRQRFLDQRLDA